VSEIQVNHLGIAQTSSGEYSNMLRDLVSNRCVTRREILRETLGKLCAHVPWPAERGLLLSKSSCRGWVWFAASWLTASRWKEGLWARQSRGSAGHRPRMGPGWAIRRYFWSPGPIFASFSTGNDRRKTLGVAI